jgi:prepilin-type N-terminal cleavage/methylation domain-containing protein
MLVPAQSAASFCCVLRYSDTYGLSPPIYRWLMNRGMTLIELLVAVVIIGILAGAAAPRVAELRDRYLVSAAAASIAGAHNRARIHAVLESRVTELEVRADSLIIRVVTPTATNVIWSIPGPIADGVTFSSPARKLSFAPTGVALGFANATFVVNHGNARRQVIVSRMGRVRVIP